MSMPEQPQGVANTKLFDNSFIDITILYTESLLTYSTLKRVDQTCANGSHKWLSKLIIRYFYLTTANGGHYSVLSSLFTKVY